MENPMKYLLILAALAIAGATLVGCGSGDAAPTDPKDQLAEMRSKVPPGTPTVPPELATEGMQTMGSNAGIKKKGN
jgi:hypothetical protein